MALVGGFLAHVLPFGKEVDALNVRFEAAKKQALESEKTIRAPETTAEEFASAVRLLKDTKLELENVGSALEPILSKNTPIRSVWKRPSFSSDSIDQAVDTIHAGLEDVPARAKEVLTRAAENATRALENATSSQQIDRTLRQVEKDVSEVVRALAMVSSSKERLAHLKSSILDAVGASLSEMANSGLRASSRARESATESAQQAIGDSSDIGKIVKIAESNLVTLQSEEELLRRLGSFKPGAAILQDEFAALKRDAAQMTSLLAVVQKVLVSQRTANGQFEAGIKTMDQANARLQRLERFASSRDIGKVHDAWEDALSRLASARSALEPPAGLSSLELGVWTNCNRTATSNIDEVRRQASAHRDFLQAKYGEARNQESTVQGSILRSAGRGMDRLRRWAGRKANEFSRSRIGKEIGISAKMLILGTKAFYDLQDPDANLMAWAMSYEGDVDKLMREIDEVQRMEEPSLTGKNTFIEDLIDQAYERSFE